MNNQDKYLAELRSQLSSLSKEETNEIIQDYREHFEMAKEAGRSEDEIIKRLGKPKSIAQGFIVNTSIEKITNKNAVKERSMLGVLISSLLALLMLAPLNFLVLFGPAVVILSFITSLWGTTLITVGVSSVAYWTYVMSGDEIMTATWSQALSILFAWIGILGLAGLLGIISYIISKFFIEMTLKYAKWNINFVLNKSKGNI